MSKLLTIAPNQSLFATKGRLPTVNGERPIHIKYKDKIVAMLMIDEQDGEVNICIDTHPDAKFQVGGYYPSLNRKRWFLKIKDADIKEEEE